MRYEWLVRQIRVSLLAAIGVACTDEVPASPAACADPQPLEGGGFQPSGWVECADESIDRVSAGICALPAIGRTCGDEASGTDSSCAVDADCTDRPLGRCTVRDDIFFLGCSCAYGCKADADCGDEQVCLCLPGQGSRCVRAECQTASDCESGACGLVAEDSGCGIDYSAECRAPSDSCRSSADCEDGAQCLGYTEAGKACEHGAICGRPLMVDGQVRLAAALARGDWSAALVPGAVPAETRAALVAFWSHLGALEHASVASFAQFSLQLMALGGPPDLLAEAQQAAADEVVHAQLCYGLASAYSGAPVGPGPLPVGDLRIDTDPAAVVASLVDEACVGETLGAAEALAAAAACTDPAVAAVWQRIAADELRHAELGWRTLRWLLEAHPQVRPAARVAFDSAIEKWRLRARSAAPGVGLPGVPSRRARAAVHLAALDGAVGPCAALLS